MSRDNSLRFISYLQTIGIILVVAGHSLHLYPDGNHGMSTTGYKAIYSFHMPLFMFVSGFLLLYTFLLRHRYDNSPTSFFKSKCKRLIIPFVVLTMVTFVPRSMMSGMADDAYDMSFQSFLLAFVDSKHFPIPYFWFLHASFILLTTTFVVFFYSARVNIPLRVTVPFMCLLYLIFCLLPMSVTGFFAISDVKRLGVYFLLGSMYCLFYNRVNSLIPWTKVWFLALSAACWGVTFALYRDSSLIIVSALFGIAMCVSITRIIEVRNYTFLDHLTGANYMIFLISWYCNVCAQQVLSHFVELPWWVHSVLSIVSGIYIPFAGYKYLQKHPDSRWVRLTAFLLGQSLPRQTSQTT